MINRGVCVESLWSQTRINLCVCALYYSRNAETFVNRYKTELLLPFGRLFPAVWFFGGRAVGRLLGGCLRRCCCFFVCGVFVFVCVSVFSELVGCTMLTFVGKQFSTKHRSGGARPWSAHILQKTRTKAVAGVIFSVRTGVMCMCVAPLLFQTCRGLCDCAGCATGCMDMCVGVWRVNAGRVICYFCQPDTPHQLRDD